jgi:UDP-N-acetylmuramate dehydrogenase
MVLKLQKNRRLAEFSTFGIGGPILYFASVATLEEMEEGFRFCREEQLPFLVIGKGSNCLFHDAGFHGLVLQNKIHFFDEKEAVFHVGAGYSFSLLGSQTARKGFTGLEFASGIPATVGGAVFMNAGANGKETADALQSISYLHSDGKRLEYKREEIEFGYRFSSFQKMKGAIISATFRLQPSASSKKQQLKIIDYRKQTQPLKEKSIGCIFRNPSFGVSAGAVIEQCGLKGAVFGDAKVSELHANFIVNQGKATACDVGQLIKRVQEEVFQQTRIYLEVEIRMIDEFFPR